MNPMDQYRESFREEASELLSELEATLLELEEAPEDLDIVARAFRAMHTIKGSGAMFGFDAISGFTHEMETVFDRVRKGELRVSKNLVGIALAGKDLIRAMLDAPEEPGPEIDARTREIVRALRECFSTPKSAEAEPAATRKDRRTATYRIRYRPQAGAFRARADPVVLLDGLRQLGQVKVVAQTRRIPKLSELDPESCYLEWDAILTTDCCADAIRDVFLFVQDPSEVRIDEIDEGSHLDREADYKKLGDILVERGDLTTEDMKAALACQKRFGEILEEKSLVPTEVVQSALVEQQAVREVRAKREAAEASSSIRVAADKLDGLVDLVGELVIAQARLSQMAGDREDQDLTSISEEIERLSAELRDSTLNIRMLPIGTTFGKFRRLVRDLANELGKEIDLVTEGAETELDKTVIERLGDPLVHIIRNSVDHGIEPPDVRRAAGKPSRGTVDLNAYHSGPNVYIEVRDDGAGFDAEAIRAKAVEQGLVAPEARLSEKEIYNLLFLPGFSTAKNVTSVSGRGVGMDVVKRSIDSLRGTVELEGRKGAGSTIRIKLPLTLAIIEGLLVAVGQERFVLPLSLVEECVELTEEDVARTHGRQFAAVRGELVPYLRLREWFRIPGEAPAIEQIAITNVDRERFGFVVDHVVGQHQTVIKNLGKMYQDVVGLSGATILGDGTVALIIDLPKLVQTAVTEIGT